MVTGILAHIARGATLFNVLSPTPLLKIHPAIGVARVGDSPGSFFIGPERPLELPTGQHSGVGSKVPPFRDAGKIKRQGARFRVFYYPPGAIAEELNLDHPEVAEIEWTVHVANKKAAFFKFAGQTGAAGPFTGGAPPRRNPAVPAAARNAKLVIDPGPRSIRGAGAGPVKFDTALGNWPKNAAGTPVIDYLGELRTDSKGRLVVLGGRGTSACSVTPATPLLDYANNDNWFDDISDGPVTAKVTLKSGRVIPVQFPGWVLVGPPDFAPLIRSVVSLYDTMLDIAVRKLPDPVAPFHDKPSLDSFMALKASFKGTPGHKPEWWNDIHPTIEAARLARFVHKPVASSHVTLALPDLLNPAPAAKSTRESIFNFLRPPGGNTVYSGTGSMPKLFGDNYFVVGDPRRVLALPPVQYHILQLWKDGSFIVGPQLSAIAFTPEGLDRAALEGCVGGAFFPGIECSWLVREGGIYSEPFRVRHGATVGPLTVEAGFFSQQMALPWQADFMDCAGDPSTLGTDFGWWPAQRPDNVYKTVADATAGVNMVEWVRGVPPPTVPTPPPGAGHARMVLFWSQLGFVWPTSFGPGQVHVESERTLL